MEIHNINKKFFKNFIQNEVTNMAEQKKYYSDFSKARVLGVRKYEDTLYFTLSNYNVTYNNLAVRKNSTNGQKFIAEPSQQGKDGKWYPFYKLNMKLEDIESVIAKVEAKLAETELP